MCSPCTSTFCKGRFCNQAVDALAGILLRHFADVSETCSREDFTGERAARQESWFRHKFQKMNDCAVVQPRPPVRPVLSARMKWDHQTAQALGSNDVGRRMAGRTGEPAALNTCRLKKFHRRPAGTRMVPGTGLSWICDFRVS